MYIGPHTCMSGYVSAYHGVGKLCILLHTILCHAGPTLHKHNGVMEAITHCGGMLNWCESKFIDVTRPFIYKDMGNDTVRQADQYDQSAAEHLTRKVNKRPACSCTETAARAE